MFLRDIALMGEFQNALRYMIRMFDFLEFKLFLFGGGLDRHVSVIEHGL